MTHSLIEMLKYRRPEGGKTQAKFCKRYLSPIFGDPDSHGNYVLIQGESPRVCFAAHHDTVHRKEGMQSLVITSDIVMTLDKDSNCLGADCTTGIWLILGLIDAGVPGVYVIHAGEESGCVGSRALIDDKPLWLETVQSVISFDRRGQDSIVTHQMGLRTCSDAFAVSLSQALDVPQLRPDDSGAYTDSESYAGLVPECTNLSVGYLDQHTNKESQDLYFADVLLKSLICVDWQSLVIERDPADYVDAGFAYGGFEEDSIWEKGGLSDLEQICFDYPEAIAGIIDSYGLTADDIAQELGLNNSYYRRGQ